MAGTGYGALNGFGLGWLVAVIGLGHWAGVRMGGAAALGHRG